jgi:hypothetical protein
MLESNQQPLQCERLRDVSAAYRMPANQHISASTLLLTLQVIGGLLIAEEAGDEAGRPILEGAL